MALHGWGQPMSIAHIAAELGISPNGLGLGDARVRALLGDQGAVYMSNAYGKSDLDRLTIGRYDNSGRTYIGYQSASPTGANFGAYAGKPTAQGVITQLIIQHWSQYDNKIICSTNTAVKQPINLMFQIAGQTFNFKVTTNDQNGVAIPNAMYDLWLINLGKVCLVKAS